MSRLRACYRSQRRCSRVKPYFTPKHKPTIAANPKPRSTIMVKAQREKIVRAGIEKTIRAGLVKQNISGAKLEKQVQKKVQKTIDDLMVGKGCSPSGNVGMVKKSGAYLQTDKNGDQYYEFGIGGEGSKMDLDGDGVNDSRRYMKVMVSSLNKKPKAVLIPPPPVAAVETTVKAAVTKQPVSNYYDADPPPAVGKASFSVDFAPLSSSAPREIL